MSLEHVQLSSYCEVPEASSGETRQLLVMANLKAPTMKAGKERPPVSISAVIDKSGSMEGANLELTKETLQFVVGNLNENDEFGVIAYSTDVTEALKLTRMDANGRRLAMKAINNLKADDYTNLSGGLFAGIKQLKGPQALNRSQPGLTHTRNLDLDIGSEHMLNVDGTVGQQWKLFVQLGQRTPGTIEHCVATVHYDILKEDSTTAQRVTVAQAPFELIRLDRPKSVNAFVQLSPEFGGGTFAFPCTPSFTAVRDAKTYSIPAQRAASSQTLTSVAYSAERNDVCAVWLFTDGLANEGITDHDELIHETKKRLQGMAPPCSIFTFGLGQDHDAQLLKEVADAGKGIYYYIENQASIAKGFADCLGGLFSVVTRSITLTASTIQGYNIRRVITKYDKQLSPQEAKVTIPDLYSEEERDILMVLEVPQLTAPDPTPRPVMQFKVKYYNMQLERWEKTEVPVILGRPLAAGKFRMHPNMEKQHHRVLCTRAMEDAKRLADQNRLEEARQRLGQVIQMVVHSHTAKDPFSVTLVQDVQGCLNQLKDRHSYMAEGSYRMMSAVSSHAYQRGSSLSPAYTTSSKQDMISSAGRYGTI